eukprot:TRINITY_DN2468_c1_g1_i6.p2 TRINITY_DN2468_c1_g1~~TRINITY_DN2468_c1_g1_i6.p2  ORF type:complete len:241 (+),score=54.13 TRINITY_DN2468_c1_g1_i6:82-723(+)
MWRGASLRLLLLALLAGAETPAARPLVLVCVCGQQGRLLLEPLTARLLRPNLPSHRFHLRFHLQRGPVHFSTDLAQPPGGPRGNASGLRSAPSPFAAWGEHRTRAELGAALQGLAELVTVRFWDPAPEDDWRSSVGRLDVVWLYRRMQDKLLNTWRLQQNCRGTRQLAPLPVRGLHPRGPVPAARPLPRAARGAARARRLRDRGQGLQHLRRH